MVRLPALLAAALLIAVGPGYAQWSAQVERPEPDARELLDRTAAWVARFIAGFVNVVAEEDYRQEWQFGDRRRLTSDFLLVGYPGREGFWLAFRDVTAVNGRPVHDQQDRLIKLFTEPFDDAVQRAQEISLEASRHSLVELGILSSPLVVLVWLQPYYHPDFVYRLGERRQEDGLTLRELRLTEIAKPSPNPAVVAIPTIEAAAWVDESSGRVLRTEARVGIAPNTATSTTTFRLEPSLGIDVPAEMRESRVGRSRTRVTAADQFTGVATYRRFRRFAVRTEEAIEPPAVSPR